MVGSTGRLRFPRLDGSLFCTFLGDSRGLPELRIHDLEEHIKFEINFTPLSWRKRYNLLKGSTHGLCHNLTQLGYFRPDYSHPSIHNLYFVGASTRPGTGMPTVMVSGRQSARRILDGFSAN